MWQSVGFVPVDPFHRFRRHHRIDDGFLHGLHGSIKKRIDFIIGQLYYFGEFFALESARIAGRKGQEDIPRTIFAPSTHDANTQRHAGSNSFQLMR